MQRSAVVVCLSSQHGLGRDSEIPGAHSRASRAHFESSRSLGKLVLKTEIGSDIVTFGRQSGWILYIWEVEAGLGASLVYKDSSRLGRDIQWNPVSKKRQTKNPTKQNNTHN